MKEPARVILPAFLVDKRKASPEFDAVKMSGERCSANPYICTLVEKWNAISMRDVMKKSKLCVGKIIARFWSNPCKDFANSLHGCFILSLTLAGLHSFPCLDFMHHVGADRLHSDVVKVLLR